MSFRPPPTISHKDKWTFDLDSDVARSSKEIQRIKLKPNTNYQEHRDWLQNGVKKHDEIIVLTQFGISCLNVCGVFPVHEFYHPILLLRFFSHDTCERWNGCVSFSVICLFFKHGFRSMVLFLNLMGEDITPQLWKKNQRILFTITVLCAKHVQNRKLRPDVFSNRGFPVN